MKTKVYRPFWSYDVQKTEEWLTSMSEKGHVLVGINRLTRYFIFQQGEQRKRLYRIGFNKLQMKSLSNYLLDNGWAMVLQNGNWYVVVNDKPLKEIQSYPVRDHIIKHNKKIMYLFGSVLIYLTMIVLFNLLISVTVFSQDRPVHFVKSPLWIITFFSAGVGMILWGISFYSVIKIKKSNKKLLDESIHLQESRQEQERPSRNEIKQLRRSGQIVVRRKYAWTYAPDKLEKWLETMEENGLNLYYVGKTGTTFYFKKGTPRRVSYCADYQNYADDSYYAIHRDAGWKSIYFTPLNLQKWTLWSYEYSRGEEPPKIYSDKFHQLKHAKRVAVTYSCIFLPFVVIYLIRIATYNPVGYIQNFDLSQISQSLLNILVVLILGSFTIRTWLYYRRIR